jgi:hypothetical protein
MILVDYAGQVTYTKRIELMRKPERVPNSLLVPPAWLSWLSLSGSREKKGKLIVVAIPTSMNGICPARCSRTLRYNALLQLQTYQGETK